MFYHYKNGRLQVFDANKDGGEGNGSGGSTQQQVSTQQNQGDSVAQAFAKMIEKHGSAEALARWLYDDNYKARDEIRQMKTQLPGDGSVVLGGDDAKAWSDYQKLGKPGDLRSSVATLAQVQGELATAKRDGLLRDVADAANVKFSVLRTLDRADLSYSIKDEKDDKGNPLRTIYIKVGEGAETKFDDYAKANWSDFLPALKPATAQAGTQFVKQDGGNQTKERNIADMARDALASRYSKKKAA